MKGEEVTLEHNEKYLPLLPGELRGEGWQTWKMRKMRRVTS